MREDKDREASQGFDGTWVAHPDLVPVALESFDRVLGERPNQIDRQRDDVEVGASELLDVRSTPGDVTEEGLRSNVSVGIQYLAAWLRGSGAVAINNLMEDAATAEISRSQIWQWLRHDRFADDDVRRIVDEEIEKLGDDYDEARALFERIATERDYVEFLDAAGVRPTGRRRARLTSIAVRVAVVGAGAMGSVYAALLASAGNDVVVVDAWDEHVAAIRAHGLRVEGASGDRVVELEARTDTAGVGPVELVVIATKATDVRDAAAAARPLLGDDTVVLPIQNGLGSADAVAEILGEDAVVIGVAEGFGASLVGPAHAHHHGMALVRLGERRGPVSPRVERIADLWRAAGFTVETYDDVDRLVWQKLVCNVSFSGTCASST